MSVGGFKEGVMWLWEGSLGSTASAINLTTSGHVVAYATDLFLLFMPKSAPLVIP